MKLIGVKLKHEADGFILEVTTCNSRIATTKSLTTGEIIKFNRPKLEYMINKKIFKIIDEDKS